MVSTATTDTETGTPAGTTAAGTTASDTTVSGTTAAGTTASDTTASSTTASGTTSAGATSTLRKVETPARNARPGKGARDATNSSTGTATTPAVDVDWLSHYLLGTWAEARLESRRVTARPEMQRIEGQTVAEHRKTTLGQLRLLAKEGAVNKAFPTRLGGQDDHGGNIAGFEELVTADPSLQIKSGVQWGLFGAAVLHLGTQYHHDTFLPAIMSLEVPGAFAMTETGHGSDVASIGTTATYDPATEEFVLNTPFRGAWKDYLGNAAVDGTAAVVFAQLVTEGVNHGVHAFYVPIRAVEGESESESTLLDGVGGEDDGIKGGLNGIDNGRLHFDHVRVPRLNLLNRYGDVAADGTYTSSIASPGRRFFTMLGTLVQGRVSLDGASTAAAKIALKIAITYGSQRRQFTAGSDTDEEVLLDYQKHQSRLIPRLATTYAASFAHEVLLTKFDSVFSGVGDTDADRQDLETLAAALKPLSTWHGLDTLQEAREACGGAGFLAENRLTSLRADLDVYATFEGDNHVLLQLVAKRLLTDYSRRFAKADVGVLARYAVEQATDRTVNGTGLRRLAQNVSDRGSVARSVGQLRSAKTQRALLTDRVETMVAEIAGNLRPASQGSKKPGAKKKAADLFNQNQNAMIEAARAHGELLQWEAFTDALAKIEHPGTKMIMTWVRDLFGLGLIQKHAAWYLINGRLSPSRAKAVEAYIERLTSRLRPHALDLVDAFGYGPEHVRAPIASGAEAERQNEARDYYRELHASGNAPVDEKAQKK